MIPDPQDMQDMALTIELRASANGWDAPPLLGFIYESTPGNYRVIPAPVQPQMLHENVPGALAYMADKMLARRADPEARKLIKVLGGAGGIQLAGIFFQSEGWSAKHMSPELRAGRRLADIPGSIEVRTVAMVDCGGRAYWVNRDRGGQPSSAVEMPGSDEWRAGGRVYNALRDMLLAIVAELPDGAVDLAAIDRIGRDVPDDVRDLPEQEAAGRQAGAGGPPPARGGGALTDEERAARFWDERQEPSLRRDGIPGDALTSMRERYIAAACADQEAVRQLREMYACGEDELPEA